MAEEGRAVCVYGLPTDVDHERLRDKLQIHFLRQRNGGGEVTSVTIIGRTPLRALIAFEDSRVVQSVLRHHPHILQVDGVKYELSLSLQNQEPLSLNKVVLGMTVIVDCSQLPQGTDTLNVLHSEFPGLHMESDLLQHTCTLQGSYSDVQGAFSYIQSLFNNYISRADNHSFSGDNGQASKKKEDLKTAKKRNSFSSHPSGTAFNHSLNLGNHSSISMVGFGQERYGLHDNNDSLIERSTQTRKSKMEEGAACRIDESDLEDFSIIMEADVFAYLQSIKEYKQILQHHGVHVVDVTSEGVTTIYLQSEVQSGSEMKQNIRQAHKELRQLYQQQELCLRKDQIPKSSFHMSDGLNAIFKKVQSLVPNVLLSHDQNNIYVVGEKSEVSQAKQLLVIGVDDAIRSITEMPPSSSSSLSASSESLEREQQVKRNSEAHTSVPPKLIGSSTERKGEVGNTKEYKLAARFKSSGLRLSREEMGGDIRSLTSKMDMLKLASNSQSTPPTRPSFGPIGALSNELTGEGTEAFRMTDPICSGEDVLFKIQEPLSVNTFGGATFNTSKAKPTTSAGLTLTPTTGVKISENRSVNSLSASKTKMKTDTPSSTSSLRRSNSFSGRPYLREQVQNNQITPEPMIFKHTYQRARSNSISGGRQSEDFLVPKVEAELTVSFLMWEHIKEVYCTQLDAIKSDLQMSEKKPHKGYVSVTLKGTDSSRVEECHRQLQDLVALVASDFCIQELSLTDLGVVEKDKLFETCCMSIRLRYPKVTLLITKTSIFLFGSKQLCSQVSEIFKDVLPRQKSHLPSQMKPLQEDVDHGAAKASLSIQSIKTDHSDRNLTEFSFEDTSKELYICKSGSQSAKLESATLEGLENATSLKDELRKTNSIRKVANAKDPTGPKMDGPYSLPLTTHKKQDSSKTKKQTNLLSHSTSEQCVCGATGTHVKRTACGVILCSNCKMLHSHCRVCGKEEVNSQKKVPGDSVQGNESKDILKENQTQEQLSGEEESTDHKGIQGSMSWLEMPVSLAGHPKYTTAKITYNIPDGIQGEKDPCPGSPFEGGRFEAYLPLNPIGHSLLPSLKKAFHQGLTFTITLSKKTAGDAKVTWGKIPHKTKMEGGKSKGYPDSSYLPLLSDTLVAHGIE